MKVWVLMSDSGCGCESAHVHSVYMSQDDAYEDMSRLENKPAECCGEPFMYWLNEHEVQINPVVPKEED